MISMYSDAALEQPFGASGASGASGARANVRSIDARREAVSDRHDSPSAPARSGQADEAVVPESVVTLLKSKTRHDDSLDAARGMMLAIVLGLGCWTVIGGFVRLIFF